MNIQNLSTETKPFARFLARIIDIFILSGIIVFFWKLASPSFNFESIEIELVLAIPVVFFWMFIEPIFLSYCGATFGKWLLKIKLRDNKGDKLAFPVALKRSFLVWFKCLGMGLPLVCLLTYFIAYQTLKKRGITTWDKSCGVVVEHPQKIGFIRLMLAILLIGVFNFVTPAVTLPTIEGFILAIWSFTPDPE